MSVLLDRLTFRYSGGLEPALSDVCAEFRPREVTLVTGQLGAGCSTLLLAIAGLAPRSTGGDREGEVLTLGHDPASPVGTAALAGRIGLLFPTPWTQLSGMAFTVWDEVAFGPANLGWERGRIAQAVVQALALLDVNHLAGRDPRSLSGGELQRVMLAAVVAMEPSVCLLDEPVQELDPEGARAVYDLLPRLADQGTVILASTDIDRAITVTDRIVVMERGHLVADGAPDDVLATAHVVRSGLSTTIATLGHRAGCPGPFPLTVEAAVARYSL
jgi:energy-coupling factor transporter ATP-binding protein EcfA2